jgi:hypothetical protein
MSTTDSVPSITLNSAFALTDAIPSCDKTIAEANQPAECKAYKNG